MSFHNFRAEGAFLVSAKRENGTTRFVRIESLADQPCKVKTDMSGTIKAHGNRSFNVTDLGNNVIQVDLNKNEWVILYANSLPSLDITQVPVIDNTNYWGTISSSQKQIDEPSL